MIVVCDIEANRLYDPDKIWCIVCIDTDTGKEYSWNWEEHGPGYKDFKSFASGVSRWIGHNFLVYDAVVLRSILGIDIDDSNIVDTLVCSKLLDYRREGGHSLEAWGNTFGIPKVEHLDYSSYSSKLLRRCTIDTKINLKLYLKLKEYIWSNKWKDAVTLEHQMQVICNKLERNGFSFNVSEAQKLLAEIEAELSFLDKEFKTVFKPKTKLIREIHPTLTSFGTLNKKDFRFVKDGNLTEYNGGPFSRFEWVEFNPNSTTQVVKVLYEAGWKPTEKTQGHIELEREFNRWKKGKSALDIKKFPGYSKLEEYGKYGYKINENNLATLPDSAPQQAKLLARHKLLESRRSTLVEWLSLVKEDGRIHGHFNHIGAWTHRMSHTAPNTANIPSRGKPYSHDFRKLWKADENRLLVGVDAEGIQLRILAHHVNEPEFTKGIISQDPHQFNKELIGDVCRDREVAKTFIYAWVLGASTQKVAQIFDCSLKEAKEAVEKFENSYTGLANFKKKQLPKDAKNGYFKAIDGRFIKIPFDDEGERKHKAMSGYLQSGEAIIMKRACVEWDAKLTAEGIPYWQVDLVHDEFQTETINNMDTAMYIASVQAEAIKNAGIYYNLNCPMAGSILSKRKDINGNKLPAIGSNWLETH